MSHHDERGHLLLAQNRYELAAREFRAVLADEPNNAEAHAFLAQCLQGQGDLQGALHEANESVRLAPLHFLSHMMKAIVLLSLDRYPEAEESALEAVSNDPFIPAPFAILAQIRLSRNNFQGCLEAATRGLALDANDATCLSLRTLANLRLGRKADAEFSAETALRNDPNDPFAHIAEGWRLLHIGDARKACEHFRTALRLEPTSTAARAGMIEALKARYWIYRQYSLTQFWLARQSSQIQWVLIIALFLAVRYLPELASKMPQLKPVIYPLVVLLVLFAFMSWIGSGLFNLLLLFHPLGRQALSRSEKREGYWLGGFLLVGIIGVMTVEFRRDFASTDRDRVVLLVMGISFFYTAMASLFATSAWYRVAEGWPRRVTGLTLAGLWAHFVWIGYLLYDLCQKEGKPGFEAASKPLSQALGNQDWLPVATAILMNVLMIRHPRRY